MFYIYLEIHNTYYSASSGRKNISQLFTNNSSWTPHFRHHLLSTKRWRIVNRNRSVLDTYIGTRWTDHHPFLESGTFLFASNTTPLPTHSSLALRKQVTPSTWRHLWQQIRWWFTKKLKHIVIAVCPILTIFSLRNTYILENESNWFTYIIIELVFDWNLSIMKSKRQAIVHQQYKYRSMYFHLLDYSFYIVWLIP